MGQLAGQPVGPLARLKTGRVTVFGPFIDGGPARPDPYWWVTGRPSQNGSS